MTITVFNKLVLIRLLRKTRRHTTMLALPLSLAFLMSACSSNFVPAPVVHLSTKTATVENVSQITGDTYIVEPGDTLFAIAFYSGNDYRELARLNNISPPYTIKLGQKLHLKPVKTQQVTAKTSEARSTEGTENNVRVNKVKQTQQQQQSTVKKPAPASENQVSNRVALNTTNNQLAWAWPASGNRTIATVGSDGSNRGLDIKGKLGAQVLAAADGKIVYAGNALKGYGNLIIIKHNNDYLSAYAHNETILVSEQTSVKQGQKIATMGSSGASEVMLHFEIRKKGKSVDPFRYLPAQ
jgi:lipoprotein NlpD